MSSYLIQKGNNLWNIVKDKYNLTTNRDIANKVNEIAKANHISNPNSIFAGSKIELADTSDPKTAEKKETTEKAKEEQGATPTTQVKKEETALSAWTKKCADSISDIDLKTGKSIYSHDVEDFDMVGQSFRDDIKNNGGKKAGEIYKQKVLDVAKGEVASYDTDNDGMISPEEQVKYDIAEAEKKYGKIDESMKKVFTAASLEANTFMDLDKNGKVDQKEYAAFLYAMDANNDNKTANGKFTREEYEKSAGFFGEPKETREKHAVEIAKFRGSVRSSYKGLFGFDPAEK